jgi:hypothetical protein
MMKNDLPTNLKELRAFATELNKGKYSNVPEHAIPKAQPFKDSSANELTKSVLYDLIEVRGAAAYRINNVGIYDAKRGVYRKGGTVKGIPDIIAVLDGRFLGIEVKYGADRQSADQRVVELEIQGAGGVYFIAKTYEGYLDYMNKL